ncbi:hypothetical protein ACA910_000497 [Epithemia clementina (nom. ined.)]
MGFQSESSDVVGLMASSESQSCGDSKRQQQPCADTSGASDDSCAFYSELSDGDNSSSASRTEDNTLEDEDALILAAASAFEGGNRSPEIPVPCFRRLRYTYLSVILVVYLADGMQGTHLYKLYDGYGFSVASLYCLGFLTGGLLSPITGPWIDKMGRKRAAMLYCSLEVFINAIEQFPYFSFLVASRVIGGFTTNLLHCVFETWLDSEFRKQKHTQLRQNPPREGDAEQVEKGYQHAYELLMRDAVIISNTAAIGSGFLSHLLAEMSGPVGPFQGAVVCTIAAFIAVTCLWTENYGGNQERKDDQDQSFDSEGSQSILQFLQEAVRAFMDDMKMLRIGIVQGFSVGSLQIFVFLWSPILIDLAKRVPAEAVQTTWGLDRHGEPAFGLIFMIFMGACVLGGMIAPSLRQGATALLTPIVAEPGCSVPTEVSEGTVRPMAVEFLAASCYMVAACMLLVPCMVSGPKAFSHSLWAFGLYELVVGIVSPCEGVIRSIYFPAHARASVWTLPSFLVNAAVSMAVFSTQFVSLLTVCMVIVGLMIVASVLQVSLITKKEWGTLRAHVKNTPRYARSLSCQLRSHVRNAPRYARSLSLSVYESAKAPQREIIRLLSARGIVSSGVASKKNEAPVPKDVKQD